MNDLLPNWTVFETPDTDNLVAEAPDVADNWGIRAGLQVVVYTDGTYGWNLFASHDRGWHDATSEITYPTIPVAQAACEEYLLELNADLLPRGGSGNNLSV